MKRHSLVCTLTMIASVMLFVQACASAGSQTLKQETEASVGAKMTEDKTTKAEVRAMFGSPLVTSFTDGGLEMWTYELQDMTADAVNYIPIVNWFGSSSTGTRKQLVILFNEDDIVKKYSMSESPVKVKTGIFNQ